MKKKYLDNSIITNFLLTPATGQRSVRLFSNNKQSAYTQSSTTKKDITILPAINDKKIQIYT